MLNFLMSNKIKDMAGLEKKLEAMTDKQFSIRDELKKVERKITTLDEHIRHSGNFKGYRGQKVQYEKLYTQYQTIKKASGFGAERRAQKALDNANDFYETNRMEITLYGAAERYLNDVEYRKLRTDTTTVEQIKRNVDDILNDETRTPQRTRAQDIVR